MKKSFYELRHCCRIVMAMLVGLAFATNVMADTKNPQDYVKIRGEAKITPDHPYFEFEVIFQDFHGFDDVMHNLNFYVIAKDGTKTQIYNYPNCSKNHAVATLYNETYGLLQYLGHDDRGDHEIGKYRFYPSTKTIQKGFRGISVTGEWDIDDNGSRDRTFMKELECELYTPTVVAQVKRVGDQTIEYRFDGGVAKDKQIPLGQYTKNGYTVLYALYSQPNGKGALFSKTTTDSTSVLKLSKTFSNADSLLFYAGMDVYKSFSIKNAIDESARIEQRYYIPYQTISVEPMLYPTNLRGDYNIWKKTITLSWDRSTQTTVFPGKWYVYRRVKGDDDTNRILIATLEESQRTYTDTDVALEYDTSYTYDVVFVPNEWDSKQSYSDITRSIDVAIVRDVPIHLSAEEGKSDIKLTWTHPQIPLSGNLEFLVEYQLNAEEEWQTAGSVRLRSTSAKEHSFTHRDITSSCDIYNYRIAINMLDMTFYSDTIPAVIQGTSHITRLDVSKGTYAGSVKLKWNAEQYGTAQTNYEVYRRPLSSNNESDWAMIYSVSGTATSYTYDDNNVAVGGYYQYKVLSRTTCSDTNEQTSDMRKIDEGFCQASGSIGGQITFGSGTAVKDVKVSLEKHDDQDLTPAFYSLRVNDGAGGVNVTDTIHSLFAANQPFSVQMWVAIDKDIYEGKNVEPVVRSSLFEIPGLVHLYAERQESGEGYDLMLAVATSTDGTEIVYEKLPTDITLIPNEYTHLNITCDGKSSWQVLKVKDFQTVEGASISSGEENPAVNVSTVTFAMPHDSIGNSFAGYIDDLRLWKKQLTNEEILANYDHLLTGQEDQLALYIPMDEGITGITSAYDYSATGGVPNNHHGSVGSGKMSDFVPADLKIYGITDSNGNYLIRGVPFASNGTNYTVTPTFGIHEFSPNIKNCYVSATSLNHNNVDFTDVSSFPVSGDVFFEGTTIPVTGAKLYVDGNICSKDGKMLETDDNGHFSIDVPIGNHFIEVKKDYHTFVADGIWPAQTDGEEKTKFYFDQEIKGLQFFDNTLVPVVGRVAGGEVQDTLTAGCGVGTNNIGIAELVLSVGDYKFNVTYDELGVSHNADSTLIYAIPEKSQKYVHSRAYVGGGSTEEVKKLHIITDSVTGEFLALLPPCNYKVESARLLHNPDIEFVTLPRLDATNVGVLQADSVEVDSILRSVEFVENYTLNYLSDAVIELTEVTNNDGAFGDDAFDYVDKTTGEVTTLPLYEVADDGTVKYTYNYPVYTIAREYEYEIHAAEKYFNYDSGDTVVYEDPLVGATVDITNEYCGEQIVMLEDGSVCPDSLVVRDIELDSLGNARYRFVAGYPNIVSPFTRNLNIILHLGDRTMPWDKNGEFNVLVFGGLPTGSNFLTEGPSDILMVLRDPPGAGSSASFKEDNTFTVTTSHSKQGGGGYKGTTNLYLGPEVKVATGLGMLLVNTSQAKSEINSDAKYGAYYTYHDASSYSITTTTAITTSSSKNFVGPDADVYFGTSYNNVYGMMRTIGLHRDSQGRFYVGLEEEMGMGSRFATTFDYTQYEILNEVIPIILQRRDSRLIYDANYKPNTGYTRDCIDNAIFVTSLDPSDPRYGSDNTDSLVWGSLASDNEMEGPSYKMILPTNAINGILYENTVHLCNCYVRDWKDAIKANEQRKVEAINGSSQPSNISVGTGSQYTGEQSVTTSESSGHTWTHSYEASAVLKWGFQFNYVGTVNTNGVHIMGKFDEDHNTTDATTRKFSYTIKPNEADRLTVDIYNIMEEGDKIEGPWGSPIFVTRAGVTHDPYEGEKKTLFYQPGTTIMTATMQMEKPSISVKVDHLTGLEPGSPATFEVHLRNESESNDTVKYLFSLKGQDSVGKPNVEVDGAKFNQLSFIIPPKEEVVKYVTMTQTDLSEQRLEATLLFMSPGQNDPLTPVGVIGDTHVIIAEYKPTSSPSVITSTEDVINIASGTDLPIKISGYDRDFAGLQRVELLYKYGSEANYTLADEWTIKSVEGKKLLPETTSFNYEINMKDKTVFPDGKYTFIVRTYAGEGSDQVWRDSEPLIITKDTQRPAVVGNPSPSDYVLNKGDVISVQFNEDIENDKITADNIIITGELNGAQVNHATALQLNGTENSLTTDAKFDLYNHDFSGECWLLLNKPTDEASIVSHGIAENGFSINVDADGHLVLVFGGERVVSEKTIDFGNWTYFSCNYIDDFEGSGQSVFNAQIADDHGTTRLFENLPVVSYSANGPIQIGKNFSGAIHELALWNKARSMTESQSQMYTTKEMFTPGLVAYWPMDEGMGNVVHDDIHGYDLNAPVVNWYINAPNKALKLDGTGQLSVNIDPCNIGEYDNYTVETWFKALPQANASIWSANGRMLSLETSTTGSLEFYASGRRIWMSSDSVLDGNWHHFALNMHRNGSTNLYIDGREMAQLQSTDIPVFGSNEVTIGARHSLDSSTAVTEPVDYVGHFAGDIDEFRIWKGTLTGNYVNQQRFERLDPKAVNGLVAYYPFEQTKDNITSFSLLDISTSQCGAATGNGYSEAESTPGLKSVAVLQRLDFDFTTTERSVVITLRDAPSRLQGNTVKVALRDISDRHENISNDINWNFYVDMHSLEWTTDQLKFYSFDTMIGEESSVSFKNTTAETVSWHLEGLPSWLTVNEESGRIGPLSTVTLKFTLQAPKPTSSVTEGIYLFDSEGISIPLPVVVNVYKDQPQWFVDGSQFDANMNIVGKAYVNGILNDNEQSCLAAFIDGTIVGVAYPEYNKRYDTYLLSMTVYGDGTKDAGKTVTFKFWDGKTGIIYPVIMADTAITFRSNNIWGSYVKPVIFNTTDDVEQTLSLQPAWTWISFFVEPQEKKISNLFSPVAESAVMIKNDTSFDITRAGEWYSSNLDAEVGKMYMVKMSAPAELSIIGKAINMVDTPIDISKGWNWIGFNSAESISVVRTFANLHPKDGDVVKSQNAFAIYNGAWDGTLTALEPGRGYMYKSNAEEDVNFVVTYDADDDAQTANVKSSRPMATEDTYHFTPVAANLYPTNMTILAQVEIDGTVRNDVEVGVFAGSECREAAKATGDLYFLTIPGEEADPLTFRFYADGQELEATTSEPLVYISNSHYGLPDSPFVISATTADGIHEVSGDSDGATEIFTTSGIRQQQLQRGINIIRSSDGTTKKVLVK